MTKHLQVSDLTFMQRVNLFCSTKDRNFSIPAIVMKVGRDDIEFYCGSTGVTTHVMPRSIETGNVVVTTR